MIKNEKGFTLIEILIVVAIIAILASVVLVGLGPTQQSGRDARRLSDLHEVQNGLELFYNKCGYYPGVVDGAGACQTTATSGYNTGSNPMNAALTTAGLQISTVPLDPTNAGTHQYYFDTNGAAATTYLLATVLENANNSVFTSYTAPNPGNTGTGDQYPIQNGCGAPTYCITL